MEALLWLIAVIAALCLVVVTVLDRWLDKRRTKRQAVRNPMQGHFEP